MVGWSVDWSVGPSVRRLVMLSSKSMKNGLVPILNDLVSAGWGGKRDEEQGGARRKEGRRGRRNGEEGGMRRKEGRGGRRDEEEGGTKRKEGQGGRRDDKEGGTRRVKK